MPLVYADHDVPPLGDSLSRAWEWLRAHRPHFPHLSRKAVAALAVAITVVAVVPALRWPVLRVTAAVATSLAGPITPNAASFGSLDRTTTFLAADGAVLQRVDGGRRSDPVPLESLPPHVPRAILAAEDRNFFEHPGVDPTAIARAVTVQISGGEQGGSTITQQLAKINFTGGENTLVRKAREALYATELERNFTKDELLERYVNQIYFGDGAYGIPEAAHTFFGVEPAELTVAQAATLAGKIRAPDALDPHDNIDGVTERRNDVLDAMAAEGWIASAEADRAAAEPVSVRPQEKPPRSRAPWFIDYVKDEAKRLSALGPDPETRLSHLMNDGYTVETTLNLEANEVAHAELQKQLDDPDAPTGAVVSVEPGDGAIRVMVGGVDYGTQQFNTAVQAERHPGSAFKPFVYLTALREGISPDSTFAGHSPQQFEHGGEKFEVHNYGKKSHGTLNMDDALVKSVNVAYMALGLEVGPEKIVETARRAGIDGDLSAVPSVSLGGTNPGVTPIAMAEAYATLAAEGTHAAPYAISRITDANGGLVYERKPDRNQALQREHVLVMNRPLLETVKRGTGKAAALPDREVAGKTGTSSDFRDAWFVGYTPQLATAVWVGHMDNASMEDTIGRISGGSIPAAVFSVVMAHVHESVVPVPIGTLDPDELDLEVIHKKAKTAPSTGTTTPTSVPESTTLPPQDTSTTLPPPPTSTPPTTGPPAPAPPTTTSPTTTPPTTASPTTEPPPDKATE